MPQGTSSVQQRFSATEIRMSPNEFRGLIAHVTEKIASRPLDANLEAWLNAEYPADSTTYTELANACGVGVEEGWLADREAGGIRYGRIFKALPDTHGFSVDVVRMSDIAGPHQRLADQEAVHAGRWSTAYPPPPHRYPAGIDTPRTLPSLTCRLLVHSSDPKCCVPNDGGPARTASTLTMDERELSRRCK